MPTLEISPEKVAYIVLMAREYDAKTAPMTDEPIDEADDDYRTVLQDRRDDATRSELAAFIRGLNEDEQVNLVALAWVGRGSFSLEEWDEAVSTARAERVNSTAEYLLGTPMLADFLEDGLEAFGYAVADLEDKIP